MPFGMGPWGWFWGIPYYRHFPFRSPRWFGGMFPYGYGYPWGPMTKEDEMRMLEDQAKLLQDQLGELNRRLEELKK